MNFAARVVIARSILAPSNLVTAATGLLSIALELGALFKG